VSPAFGQSAAFLLPTNVGARFLRKVSATSPQVFYINLLLSTAVGPSFSVRPENEAKEGSQDLRS